MVRFALFLVSIAGAVPPRRDVELRSLLADVDALSVLERTHRYWAQECCAPLDAYLDADCNNLEPADPKMYYPPADGSCDSDAVDVVRRAWVDAKAIADKQSQVDTAHTALAGASPGPIAPGFLAHVGITFKSFTQDDFKSTLVKLKKKLATLVPKLDEIKIIVVPDGREDSGEAGAERFVFHDSPFCPVTVGGRALTGAQAPGVGKYFTYAAYLAGLAIDHARGGQSAKMGNEIMICPASRLPSWRTDSLPYTILHEATHLYLGTVDKIDKNGLAVEFPTAHQPYDYEMIVPEVSASGVVSSKLEVTQLGRQIDLSSETTVADTFPSCQMIYAVATGLTREDCLKSAQAWETFFYTPDASAFYSPLDAPIARNTADTESSEDEAELQRLQTEKTALDALKAAETAKRTDSDSSAEEIQADPLAPRLSPAAVIARWTTYLPA